MSHRVVELYNIMPIANLSSVMEHGILSNHEVDRLGLTHQSVAREDIQCERDQVMVPQGLMLHKYANLYFNPRNPMMYKRKNEANNLCVLRVSRDALDLPGVVLSDQNATSRYVKFMSPEYIANIDFNLVFSENWSKPYLSRSPEYWRHRSVMCAEILVPRCIPVCLILGAYVISGEVASTINQLDVQILPKVFFQ